MTKTRKFSIIKLLLLLTLCTILFAGCGENEDEKLEETKAPVSDSTPVVSTPTPEETLAPTIEPTQTIPEGVPYITLPPDFEESGNATITGLEPLKQRSTIIIDPENTRGLSTERVAHWFGKDTPVQPEIFQKEYEANNWSALTYDYKTNEKVIYLTFDCGYENGYTSKILDTLKEKNIKAAFFVTMDYVEEAPDVTARMIKEGHIVGNHSDTHPDFSTISRTQMASELQKLDNYLRVNFGYSSKYFRYPMGRYNASSMDLLTNMGYRSIFWSYAYADYDEIVYGNHYAFDKVTSNLHPGEVLLLHAISADNANDLADIIDYAQGQGYEFRTLDEYAW